MRSKAKLIPLHRGTLSSILVQSHDHAPTRSTTNNWFQLGALLCIADEFISTLSL